MSRFASKLLTRGAAFMAVLAVAACEQAEMAPEVRVQVTRLTSDFQNICGVLASTDDLSATRKALLGAGYESRGVVKNTRGYGFSDFEHFSNGTTQVQLSDRQPRLSAINGAKFCGVVTEGMSSQVPEGIFEGAATAIANANGATTSSPPMIRLNESGTRQFKTGGRIVRLGHQSYPAGLVLYTFSTSGEN